MTPRRASPPPADRSKLKNVALFKDEENLAPNKVSLDDIVLPATQPRRYFEPQAMQSLVESVKQNGILQPLLVRPAGNKYELVAGERRYRAAQEAALTEVPITVRQMSDEQAAQYALTENLQREDLNPIEETEGTLQLLALRLGCETAEVSSVIYKMENEAKGKITRNVSGNSEAEIVEKVFAELGKISWQSFIRTRLPLLKLPEDILSALRTGQIEYTKAKEIAKLTSKEERTELLEATLSLSLSLSEIQQQVKAKQPPARPPTLQNRLEATYKQAKKSKVWENPQKQKKLESLLGELEALMADENKNK
jgi:ParB family transcriptional regulator, chromosome partitioning protein